MESLNLKVLEVWCAILHGREPHRLARSQAPAQSKEVQSKHDLVRRERFQAMAAKRHTTRDKTFTNTTSRYTTVSWTDSR